MDVTFFGVRGSIASPGAETARVGGNTSTIEVRCGDRRIVLDAGTGLRALGQRMLAAGDERKLTLLLSHYHWDHIQGLPFFTPIYMPGTEIEVVGQKSGLLGVRDALELQMGAPVFPVRFGDLPSRIVPREVRPREQFDVGEARVRVARGNHPGGVLAYRIDFGGASLVYATDTEHYACLDPELFALAEGATMLVYDAQYTEAEYRAKVGWGHSTNVAAAELARASGVEQLVLFHHDPTRDDAGVAAMEAETQGLFAATVAAREGATFLLGRGGSPRKLVA
jgi:phosphoribosyl 1,2-cyclic phosphodiesterase